MRADRSLSQNFLINRSVAKRTAAAALSLAPERLIEIGPGHGALTIPLAESGLPLIAIEKDRNLIAPLRERFARFPAVQIVEGDALDELPILLSAQASERTVIATNLPYAISGAFFRILTTVWPPPAGAVAMLQKEVALRLTAATRTKSYGVLSVLIGALYQAQRLFDVSPGSFMPAPAVLSSVVRLRSRPEPVATGDTFEELVRCAFSQRRKQLRNTLERQFFDKQACAAALSGIGHGPRARAEELSIEDFAALARIIRARIAQSDQLS